METDSNGFRSIIVPIDFSPISRAALARAIAIARRDGSKLHLLHAVNYSVTASPYDYPITPNAWELIVEGQRSQMTKLKQEITEPNLDLTAEVAELSNPVNAIREAVAARNADLVVMGTHGYSGLKHVFLGSVAERTIRVVPCPVLAVKEEQPGASAPIERILVATDFSSHSVEAENLATRLAKNWGAEIDILHVFNIDRAYIAYSVPGATEFEERMRQVAAEKLQTAVGKIESAGVTVRGHSSRGAASDVIAREAKRLGSQLIVMGTKGNTGLAHVFLGSVTERTLRLAECSVLTTKVSESSESTPSRNPDE